MSDTIDLTKLFPPDPITTINLLDAYAPIHVKGWGTKCILPWTHLHVWPNHNVFPCCITNYKVGSTKNDTMKDIWNNDEMKTIFDQLDQFKNLKIIGDVILYGRLPIILISLGNWLKSKSKISWWIIFTFSGALFFK